jgi:hypothetical protein
MEKGTWIYIVLSTPATSRSGYNGLGMFGRRDESGYGTWVGRRRVKVYQGLRVCWQCWSLRWLRVNCDYCRRGIGWQMFGRASRG